MSQVMEFDPESILYFRNAIFVCFRDCSTGHGLRNHTFNSSERKASKLLVTDKMRDGDLSGQFGEIVNRNRAGKGLGEKSWNLLFCYSIALATRSV